MSEEIIKMLADLGSDGVTAFYVYLIVDTIQLFGFLGLVSWGISGIWAKVKHDIFD